jgi:hypothetical protein
VVAAVRLSYEDSIVRRRAAEEQQKEQQQQQQQRGITGACSAATANSAALQHCDIVTLQHSNVATLQHCGWRRWGNTSSSAISMHGHWWALRFRLRSRCCD